MGRNLSVEVRNQFVSRPDCHNPAQSTTTDPVRIGPIGDLPFGSVDLTAGRAVEIPFELVHRGDPPVDWMSRLVARRSATGVCLFCRSYRRRELCGVGDCETPYSTAGIADAAGTGSER